MKKTVRVTIEKEIEIDVYDDIASEEFLNSFSKVMWPVDSVDEIFEYIATRIAEYGNNFVEGVGRASRSDESAEIEYKVVYEDVCCDIL